MLYRVAGPGMLAPNLWVLRMMRTQYVSDNTPSTLLQLQLWIPKWALKIHSHFLITPPLPSILKSRLSIVLRRTKHSKPLSLQILMYLLRHAPSEGAPYLQQEQSLQASYALQTLYLMRAGYPPALNTADSAADMFAFFAVGRCGRTRVVCRV